MPTMQTRTAVIGVAIDMSIDEANALVSCLGSIPQDMSPLRAFLETLAQECDLIPPDLPVEVSRPLVAAEPPPAAARPVGKRGPRGKLNNIDPAWLRDQYVTQRRSTSAIAKELGCSDVTIGAALKKHGIPARPFGNRQPANPQPGQSERAS